MPYPSTLKQNKLNVFSCCFVNISYDKSICLVADYVRQTDWRVMLGERHSVSKEDKRKVGIEIRDSRAVFGVHQNFSETNHFGASFLLKRQVVLSQVHCDDTWRERSFLLFRLHAVGSCWFFTELFLKTFNMKWFSHLSARVAQKLKFQRSRTSLRGRSKVQQAKATFAALQSCRQQSVPFLLQQIHRSSDFFCFPWPREGKWPAKHKFSNSFLKAALIRQLWMPRRNWKRVPVNCLLLHFRSTWPFDKKFAFT